MPLNLGFPTGILGAFLIFHMHDIRSGWSDSYRNICY